MRYHKSRGRTAPFYRNWLPVIPILFFSVGSIVYVFFFFFFSLFFYLSLCSVLVLYRYKFVDLFLLWPSLLFKATNREGSPGESCLMMLYSAAWGYWVGLRFGSCFAGV
jgi:hypothetical protein